jgi:hypothetical protein
MPAGNDACRPPARGSRRCGQTSSRYKRADAGHTFSPSNPLVGAGEMPLELGRRIDYIMIRSGIHGPTLAIADCRRVLDRRVAGIWASDHFGWWLIYRFPRIRPGPGRTSSSTEAPSFSEPGTDEQSADAIADGRARHIPTNAGTPLGSAHDRSTRAEVVADHLDRGCDPRRWMSR